MVDWYPTILKLCGAKLEQALPLDGRAIWPTLTEGKPSPHDAILINTTPNTGAVRAGDWKLVIKNGTDDPDGGPVKKAGKESVELFSLKDDPYEKTNLADQNAEKVKELRTTLAEFAKQAVPPKTRPKAKDFVSPKVWGEKD
jgi:arylsulfatase A-like enzyme